MDISLVKSQIDDSIIIHSSSIGIILYTFLALVYFTIGALSVFQSLSALEPNSSENAFETNGTKIRPYFLSIFSIGIVSRLLYIIIYLVLNLLPKLISSGLINKLIILKVFDYLINIILLLSYSIVIILWSSILTNSTNIEFSINTILSLTLYITGGFMIITTLFITQKFPSFFNILYILMGLFYLICSHFWVYYGSSLVTQIKRRQTVHNDLRKDLISKNFNFACNTNNYANSNFNQAGSSNWSQNGILNTSQLYVSQFNQNSNVNTASSLNNSNTSIISDLFIYNKAYSLSINKLRYKIQILTLICPVSLFISGLYYLLKGFGILNSNSEILLNSIRSAFYMFISETIPSIALIYGFWSTKNSFLDTQIYKNYNQENNFRFYTRIN